MATISKANFQDALDVGEGRISVAGELWGFVTGITVNGKSPEDLVNCISGTLRRKKPATVDWSCDAAILYDNLRDLQELRDGTSTFSIIVNFVNPDPTNPLNKGQQLTINECRIEDLSINIGESSTFKMSGKASSWNVASNVATNADFENTNAA